MKRVIVLAFILAVFAGAVAVLNANPSVLIMTDEIMTAHEEFLVEEGQALSIAFSETGHFFPEGVTVEILTNNPYAAIHFTTSGEFPTTDSPVYTEPITFSSNRRAEARVLRAIAVYNYDITPILTHTYFIGRGVEDRFDTLIFSISTNGSYMYDFYTGIYVDGTVRRDYLRDNPRTHVNPTTPANFNQRGRDWERRVNVEVFYPTGERVLTQEAGMRVFGSWSRAERIRSLRLIARREYSPDAGRFHYQFFPGDVIQTSDNFTDPIRAYNTLILRNGGNDRNHGLLRNELGSELARRAGFMDVTPARAAVVFINGRYYGWKWLQTRVDTHYLQELYGTPTRDFDIIGRGEWWFRNATEEQEEALTYKNYFAWRDLTDDTEFAALEAILDIDNFLWYYAFQIFLGNADWPGNNLRRWRYTGEPFDGMHENLDGRWRYALFDLDQTFGLFGHNYRRPTFQYVLTHDNDNAQLLRNVLTRQDMQERFTMMFNDIAANVVNREIVSEVLDYLYAQIFNEFGITVDAGLHGGFWVGHGSVANYHDQTLEFAARRHIFINEQLIRKFDFDNDMFSIFVFNGEANIGSSINATSSHYFAHLTIPVSPVLPPNTEFSHWVVNETTRIYEKEIHITANDAINGVVDLEFFTTPNLPRLMFDTELSSRERNGITLINTTPYPLQTEGLHLGNRREYLSRFPIPAATIAPGDSMEFVGDDSAGAGDLFRIRLPFNIRNRRIFLSDAYGNIIDTFLP